MNFYAKKLVGMIEKQGLVVRIANSSHLMVRNPRNGVLLNISLAYVKRKGAEKYFNKYVTKMLEKSVA